MGKKRVSTSSGTELKMAPARSSVSKKKLAHGRVHIHSTYNNTKVYLTDLAGGAVLASSSGALGFKGAKKGTPFAAGRVAEWLGQQGEQMGLTEVEVVVRGVGPGREAALRALAARGLVINAITDITPVPFNGPRPRKARRV